MLGQGLNSHTFMFCTSKSKKKDYQQLETKNPGTIRKLIKESCGESSKKDCLHCIIACCSSYFLSRHLFDIRKKSSVRAYDSTRRSIICVDEDTPITNSLVDCWKSCCAFWMEHSRLFHSLITKHAIVVQEDDESPVVPNSPLVSG